jgi:hypothetical protein
VLLHKAVQLVDKKVIETESSMSSYFLLQNSIMLIIFIAPNAKTMRPKLMEMWKVFASNVAKFATQYEQAKNNFSFSFVEGRNILF